MYLYRDKNCKFATSTDNAEWKKCKNTEEILDGYTLVAHTKHVYTQELECGCIIHTNRYFRDWRFPIAVWEEMTNVVLKPGQEAIRYVLEEYTEKQRKRSKKKK